MSVCTTVLGDIDTSELGHCQPHEHVFTLNTPAARLNPALLMNRPKDSLAELVDYREAGGHSLVDAQPVGAGRDSLQLIELSRRSGIQIIASTGYHLPHYYISDHWIHQAGEDELAALFTSELSTGLFQDGKDAWPQERITAKAGLVKAAIGQQGLTEYFTRLLLAAGKAAVSQGAPLMLHTEKGIGAVDAIDLLGSIGLPPERIIICHVDRQAADLEIHLKIARTGVFLDYDTIGRFKYHDDASEIHLIQQMIAAGFLGQILLSLDTTAGRFASYGGEIGLDYLLRRFLPALLNAGLSGQQCLQMNCKNPAKALERFRA